MISKDSRYKLRSKYFSDMKAQLYIKMFGEEGTEFLLTMLIIMKSTIKILPRTVFAPTSP